MSLARIAELAAASGGILYVMPLMLLLALTVSFERICYLGRMLRGSRSAMAGLAPLSRIDRATMGLQVKRLHDGPVAHLIGVALDMPEFSEPAVIERRLEEAVMREIPAIDRSLWLLDTIVTLAPLIGLLGTIIGMFNAFQILGKPGSAPTEITGGVAEALIATASGLFIAIIGIIFFNGLQTRVRLQVHELETLKMMLVNRMTADGHIGVYSAPIHLVGNTKE
jgi:biopolymer transport protein ExbB